jgi:ubiquinone/menaquinone biosynthesis C-methylase UbiE
MVLGDHPDGAGMDADRGADEAADSHWVRWHAPYEDPSSGLSQRLRAVQSMVRAALDEIPGPAAHPEPIRMVSLCAGQGRDVIDVAATHPRGPEVSALLVELDPALVAFARERAAAAGPGVAERIRIVEGDASQSHWYADDVPADIVLVCGLFGNISPADITRTIEAMRGFCVPGGHVVWTRHRRPPDLTPAIRADFAAAGFTELAFEAPEGTVMTIGHHRLDGAPAPFDPDQQLFDFVGDGWNPV